MNKPQREALIRFWETWQNELETIRVLDPAVGSGAFLIEAFDQLHTAYELSNDRLEDLRGQRSLLDLDRCILQNNLYGVDINDEAVQICRLSLWIKTAARGKKLTSLDDTIRVGNSVVDDPNYHTRAFHWDNEFSGVVADGGFDVVVANPPYIRQEWQTEYKPHLEQRFKTYHGAADIYVYFFERGLQVLRPGGLLSFIVTNKWLKAGYGEPLRRHFSQHSWVESVVDFGHAKQIFPDADVFPSIVVTRKPTKSAKPKTVRLCSIPREQLRVDDLGRQIESEGTELPVERLGSNAWQLEPKGWSGGKWPGRKFGAYKWFEIQDAIDYWREFSKPKILYQVIQFHPRYAIDRAGVMGNDKTAFITVDDLYLLSLLNSPLLWWHNWRTLTHLKDEALSPLGYMMESLPIANPSDDLRAKTESVASKLIEITKSRQGTQKSILDWLCVEHEIAKPSRKLQSLTDLNSDDFVAEVKRIRGRRNPLSVAALKSLRDEYASTIEPARAQAGEALKLECQLSDLVNEAYGLTPEEISLMWKTSPPRMPIEQPVPSTRC